MARRRLAEPRWQALSEALGYRFSDRSLLEAAMTHCSVGAKNNERLEFLGDAILNCVIAAELYHRFPKAREGALTRMRALLVRGVTLAEIAKDLNLGEHVQLGVGEQRNGGQHRGSILADALEAIIGAIFLDTAPEEVPLAPIEDRQATSVGFRSFAVCAERIVAWYETRLTGLDVLTSPKDPKTRLQEYLQERHLALPDYTVVTIEGTPHDPLFHVQCVASGLKTPVLGISHSRRTAEQAAASAALSALRCELSTGKGV